ncbi:MAG: hypothetical protein QG616_1979 [Pseudomonadota bacterium]|nr:hypothetical protein [Pseudomonadota bacterium]
MAIDNDLLMAAIDAGRESSYGSDESSSLGAKRAKAIEYYLGLNTDPAPEGRSQVVDRSVYETISTLLPSLVRIFCGSSDEVVKFTPVGPEDETGAEQTTAVVSHIVTQQNAWEQVAGDWIFDAMLLANGYAMAYWDSSDAMVRDTYEKQSDDQFALLVDDPAVRVVQHSQQPDVEADKQAQAGFQQAQQQYQQIIPQWQQAAQQAQAQGQPPPPEPPPPQRPQPQFLHDVVIERKANDGKVCISVLPPEHCYISVDTPDWTLKDCPYFEFKQEKTIADLRAMGLEVPDDISDDESSDDTDEDRARDRFSEDRFGSDDKGVMRRVWSRMIWVKADAEGEGESRLYYVIAVGRTVLYAEPTGRIPVAAMTPQPLPHRHIGMSVAETVWDIQDQKTAIKRGGLDGLYLSNAKRNVISNRVNLADMLDARPGGVVRMLDDSLPSEGHILPLEHNSDMGGVIQALEYIDQERQNRTGASRYFSGTDAGAINKTASGTIALQNMAAMRVEHIARVMAPAVEYLFECVHELISKHQNKPLAIKLKGQWTLVDPQAWRTKRDVRISVGVGAGNKESMQAQLGQIFGAQMQTLPLGLAKPEHIHATVTEIAKLAGFANPAKFWGDASQLQPMPPQPNPDQIKAESAMQLAQFGAQQDQQKFGAEQQIEQQRMQMQAELDRNREEMQARQKQLELEQQARLAELQAGYDAQQAREKLEFERWKAELDATVKLQIAGMSKESADAKAEPDTRLDDMQQMMKQMMEEAGAPTQLIRDPQSGRTVGVQKGSRTMKVIRDQNGRAERLQ